MMSEDLCAKCGLRKVIDAGEYDDEGVWWTYCKPCDFWTEHGMKVSELAALLKSKHFQYSSERDLQDGIEVVVKAAGIAYERERELGPGDIIDFLVGDIGLEVKIQGSPAEVARQLLRYASHSDIREIVLVTGKQRLGALPERLMGKPVTVVSLWRGFL